MLNSLLEKKEKLMSRKLIFGFSLAGIAFFCLIGLSVYLTNGLKNLKLEYEFSDLERQNYSMIHESIGYDVLAQMFSKECIIWSRDIGRVDVKKVEDCFSQYGPPYVVLGDSHAGNVQNILAKSNHFEFIIGISQGGCRPHKASNRKNGGCQYESLIKFLKSNQYLQPKIIFHQSGSHLIKDKFGRWQPAFEDQVFYDSASVSSAIKYLDRLTEFGSDVSWLGPYTEYSINPLKRLDRISEIPSINFEIFDNIEQEIVNQLPENSLFHYVSFDAIFQVPANPVIEDCFLWSDVDHFSPCGEDLIATRGDFSALLEDR
jgi:hypothetical protein